jgi:electron transfer flavoprotein alpha subunit
MTDYIVLVKQVPDTTQISDNAFDPVTGTLIRSRLASVINELDKHALALAHQMRCDSGQNHSKIICLTMGPPVAQEVLQYCLSRCADMAVLLSDKLLGGADTFATANSLAFAIRKIANEILSQKNDYYIITGMQSIDGDTAQVPPQIAEELSMPCIAYVTKAQYKNEKFEFTRIISGGNQIVAAKKLPAVVTVAKHEYPLFQSFANTRRANKIEIIHWTAADINANHIGATGSKTNVIRVFPPGKSTRKCIQLADVPSLSKVIIDVLTGQNVKAAPADINQTAQYILPARRANLFDRTFEGMCCELQDYEILTGTLKSLGITDIDQTAEAKILATTEHFHKKTLEDMLTGLEQTQPTYTGDVWVIAEQNNNVIHHAVFELLGKARQLSNCLQVSVGVVLAGYNVETVTQDLIAAGADNIYVINHKLLGNFDASAHRKAIVDCISKYWPQIVLFPATPQGRILAPMVSYRLNCGLTADCTGLDIKDRSRKNQIAILMQTRPALGGNIMATITTKDSKSQMATVRPGVMKKLSPDFSRTGRVILHQVDFSESDISLEVIETEPVSNIVNFNADVIVSGGKGMQNRDNYERLVGSLCDCLAKKLHVSIEKGASRAAVEHGFADRMHQVGQTGTSIAPKLYIALGISGAIQHIIGIANTDTIIAINNDPNAPIFKYCDYYVVADVDNAVPGLVQAMREKAAT